jgi:hypothetical protein
MLGSDGLYITQRWIMGFSLKCRHSQPTPFQVTQFNIYAILKTVFKIQIFETRTELLLAGMKAQVDKGGGRLLLGDNTGGMANMLRPIRFQCVRL